MRPLTDTQQRTLDFIRAYIRDNGLSPTIADIAEGMGWKSANAAQGHVDALQRKGALKVKRGENRSIYRGIVLTTTSYEHDSLALDTATRIMAIIRTAAQNKDYWPDMRIKAAVQVEVINALQSRGVK
ncbi:LexA family transcriptional regulator [Pantoea vagans]|uniref:LexA family protein n=1 Tax=Pantoea vagans TaxID=470934 RepID=UPI0023B07B70|nr:LexA family transcriptional regulator [Pantoea vagans]MDE8556078.1 LexA family transcriptional regulator [Pantoea vagans]MDE8576129.1 LexA family transcriptional regulator [Pantoea vagans]